MPSEWNFGASGFWPVCAFCGKKKKDRDFIFDMQTLPTIKPFQISPVSIKSCDHDDFYSKNGRFRLFYLWGHPCFTNTSCFIS